MPHAVSQHLRDQKDPRIIDGCEIVIDAGPDAGSTTLAVLMTRQARLRTAAMKMTLHLDAQQARALALAICPALGESSREKTAAD